jgi:hypothetical protein
MNAPSGLPRRPRGRPSVAAQECYEEEAQAFCQRILEIRSTLDFAVSARGWCYILEGRHEITKGDFAAAERLINDCRKNGSLPLDICAVDDSRTADGIQQIDETTPEEEAESWIDHVREHAAKRYTPFAFWEDLDVYVEMAVEKIDLKSLFAPSCAEFHMPISNCSGWNDINGRAAMMERFSDWESRGKKCVLLYCGDHDPGGLNISGFMHSNLHDLSGAVGWDPDHLTVDRFGLDYDFIEANGLTWIENLETSSGGRLDDPKHKDHLKPYVQNYIKRFGVRKCEANALVVRPEAGRALCRQAILRWVPENAPKRYARALARVRAELQAEIDRLLP